MAIFKIFEDDIECRDNVDDNEIAILNRNIGAVITDSDRRARIVGICVSWIPGNVLESASTD